MSGPDKSTPIPTEIKLHQVSRVLEIAFNDGTRFKLPYEFLRVYSPSAEVRGHGPGQEVLQIGKKNIEVKGIEPVGSYAVPFDDPPTLICMIVRVFGPKPGSVIGAPPVSVWSKSPV